MNIVLEGCDATGKDTYCNELARITGFEVERGSSFEIAKLGGDKMFEFMMNQLSKDDIIVNRSFYSNIVYGTLFNYPMMSEKQFKELHKKLNENSLLIYLVAQEDVIHSRIDSRGDDMIKNDDISSILEMYQNTLYKDLPPRYFYTIDTSVKDFKTASEEVYKCFEGILNTGSAQ